MKRYITTVVVLTALASYAMIRHDTGVNRGVGREIQAEQEQVKLRQHQILEAIHELGQDRFYGHDGRELTRRVEALEAATH